MSVVAVIAVAVAAQAAPAPNAAALPAVGGVTLSPVLSLQVDARAPLHALGDTGPSVEGEAGFAVARARVGGRVQGDGVAAQLVLEGARERLGLFEAWVAARAVDDVTLSAGLWRSPLFLSEQGPIPAAPLSERGLLERSLWPGRELGAGAHLAPRAGRPVEIWLRASNGLANAALGNDNAGLAFDARVDVTDAAPGTRETLRVGVGARVEHTDNEAGVAGTTPLRFQYWRPPPVSGPAALVEAHARVRVGPARVAGQIAAASEARAIDDDGVLGTPKVAQPSTATAGAMLDLHAVVFGHQGALDRAPPVGPADLGVHAIVVAARLERVSLGLAHPLASPADVSALAAVAPAGGATGGSAAVSVWLSGALVVAGQVFLTAYDVAPVEDPARTVSAVAQLRFGIALQ